MYNNDRLIENLASWMISHGIIHSDRKRSNYYTGVRIVDLTWRGRDTPSSKWMG